MVFRFPIEIDSGRNWNLYYDGKFEDLIKKFGEIPRCIFCVKKLFEEMFGEGYVNSYSQMAVLFTHDTPICYRENNMFFLSVTGEFKRQVVFQAAHELCHLMIPVRGAGKHEWFEESLCQVASIYCLKKIEQRVWTSPFTHFFSEYQSISAFILHNTNAEDIGDQSISQFLKANIIALEQRTDNREKNNIFANAMLPIFEEHPDLWKALPLLCLRENEVFEDGIRRWQSLLPCDLAEQLNHIIELLFQ